jgi:hypothetical protein
LEEIGRKAAAQQAANRELIEKRKRRMAELLGATEMAKEQVWVVASVCGERGIRRCVGRAQISFYLGKIFCLFVP